MFLTLGNVSHVPMQVGRGCPSLDPNHAKGSSVLLAVHIQLATIVDRRLSIEIPFSCGFSNLRR